MNEENMREGPLGTLAPAPTLAFPGLGTEHTKPFNIASYALLLHMLAQQCDLEPGTFVWTGGDCHLYSNHLDQARLQLARAPRPLPALTIGRRPDTIDGYEHSDFVVTGYDPHPHIAAPVAV